MLLHQLRAAEIAASAFRDSSDPVDLARGTLRFKPWEEASFNYFHSRGTFTSYNTLLPHRPD
jgi:hypothetical protein